jgi:hypothetical protein
MSYAYDFDANGHLIDFTHNILPFRKSKPKPKNLKMNKVKE